MTRHGKLRNISGVDLRPSGRQLSDEEERELEEHLDQCPTCRAIEERLAALHDSFQGLEDIPAPEGFTQGVMDRVRAEQSRPKVVPLFKRPQFKALAGLAACAAPVYRPVPRGPVGRAADNQLSVASATDLWQEEPQVNISLFEADDPQSAESENSGAEGQERSEPGGQTDISPYGAELDESAQSPAPDSGSVARPPLGIAGTGAIRCRGLQGGHIGERCSGGKRLWEWDSLDAPDCPRPDV